MMIKRKLILEDGYIFEGEGFGSERETSGEIIFNTAMTGYQEIMTNPSYYGQLLVMTNPSIGNYGTNRDDFEAVSPYINGLITNMHADHPSNFRMEETLHDFLKAHHIPGISGIDTRMLTRHIRKNGIIKGIIVNQSASAEKAIEEMKNIPIPKDRVDKVSTKQAYRIPGRGLRIVMIDLGMKHGMLRELTNRNCQITVVPYFYQVDKIKRLKPNGIIITNGPGSPEDVPETMKTIQELKDIPLFGIGLGHQLMALAFGAKVTEMAYGHHGNNYPVKDLNSDKSYMTTQSHRYTVCQSSIEGTELEITHRSLNDQDIEGLKHMTYPAFSVQFYPEGGPGPDDMTYLYDQFLNDIQQYQNREENIYA